MPPFKYTPAKPVTESARQAQLSFYCALCKKQYTNRLQLEQHQMSNDHAHKARQADREAITYGSMKEDMAATEERRRQREAVLKDLTPAANGEPKKKKGFKSTFVAAEVANPDAEMKRKEHWKKLRGESSAPQEDDEPKAGPSSEATLPTTGPPSAPVEIKQRQGVYPWSSYKFDGVDLDDAYDPEDPIECDDGCPGCDDP